MLSGTDVIIVAIDRWRLNWAWTALYGDANLASIGSFFQLAISRRESIKSACLCRFISSNYIKDSRFYLALES